MYSEDEFHARDGQVLDCASDRLVSSPSASAIAADATAVPGLHRRVRVVVVTTLLTGAGTVTLGLALNLLTSATHARHKAVVRPARAHANPTLATLAVRSIRGRGRAHRAEIGGSARNPRRAARAAARVGRSRMNTRLHRGVARASRPIAREQDVARASLRDDAADPGAAEFSFER
ncbi:MAG TPA: hypothetical protein VN672_08500 [Solirubrobacteraceae bacterium]|nr:hypothetical protein [Solirubrobacteraceae bacterium]